MPFAANENAPEAVLQIFPEFREGIQEIKPRLGNLIINLVTYG
jgi:hypothetical protein